MATALHTIQDHLKLTTVIAQRRSQKMLSEQSTSKAKVTAAYEVMEDLTQARERQEVVRRLYEQKCEEAETMFNGTIKDTLEKAEVPEKHVKTVPMRAESLATTEADLFKTLFDRQEAAQKQLNELSTQLSQRNITNRPRQ